MGWFANLRLGWHRKKLLQYLEHQQQRSAKGQVSWSHAKRIGILFNASEADMRKQVLQYAERLRSQKKQVQLLGFLPQQQEGQEYAFPVFTAKDIDWLYRPSGEAAEAFRNEPFDLLLDLSLSEDLSRAYLCALANASLKVGPSTELTYAYDLMIEVPASAGLKGFIQHMENLLDKTNRKNEPAQLPS